MDNYNIRQDRPRLSSEEIAQRKDFDSILNDYHIMKKPFFKNPWFFGVTGMASVGLLIGASYGFTDRPAEPPETALYAENSQAPNTGKTIHLASVSTANDHQPKAQVKTVAIQTQKKNKIHDNNSTLVNNTTPKPKQSENNSLSKDIEQKEKTELKQFSAALQNHPKIDDKIGGDLSVSRISKQTSIFTDSNIPIEGFEMSVETEFGAKIFSSQSNTLTDEMVAAIKTAPIGTEVFFEGIKGKVSDSKSLHLSSLKYTLTK